MLATTIVHVCLRCGSEKIRKNGRAINGAQRAKCLACGRTFIVQPVGPRYDPAFKAQVLAADQDRMSLRGIQRTCGVCYEAVRRWVGKKAGQLPACVDTLLPSRRGDVLELRRTLELCRRQSQPSLAVGGALPKDPPGGGLDAG